MPFVYDTTVRKPEWVSSLFCFCFLLYMILESGLNAGKLPSKFSLEINWLGKVRAQCLFPQMPPLILELLKVGPPKAVVVGLGAKGVLARTFFE